MNSRRNAPYAARTAHRAAALGLAAVLTVSILSTINLLAIQPEPDSLLAHRGAPAQVAAGPASAAPRT
jgi:hypothetical protein